MAPIARVGLTGLANPAAITIRITAAALASLPVGEQQAEGSLGAGRGLLGKLGFTGQSACGAGLPA